MKKSSYTFIALLLVCLALIIYLGLEKIGDQRQLKQLNEQVDILSKNLDSLEAEKLAWEGEKAQVVQNIGSVQGVLRTTLDELDLVLDSIGNSLSTSAPDNPDAVEYIQSDEAADSSPPAEAVTAIPEPAPMVIAPAQITLAPQKSTPEPLPLWIDPPGTPHISQEESMTTILPFSFSSPAPSPNPVLDAN